MTEAAAVESGEAMQFELQLPDNALGRRIAELSEQLIQDPKNVAAVAERAAALSEAGFPQEALADQATLVMLAPQDAVAADRLGLMLQAAGDFERATVCHARACAIEGGNALYFLNLGNAMREMRQWNAAAELYEAVSRLAPDAPAGWINLSDLYLRQNRFDEAEKAARAGSEAGHESALWRNLGSALYGLGRKDEARVVWEKAIAANPADEYVRHLLDSAAGTVSGNRAPSGYVESLFDGYADEFENTMLTRLGYRVPGLIRRKIMSHVFGLPPDGQPPQKLSAILDLGCGTGLMGTMVYDLTLFLKGVDLSSKMIEKARAKGIYQELETGDIMHALQEGQRPWNLILAADVLEYFGDLRPVIEAAHKRLMPGGLLIFTVEKSQAVSGDYTLADTGRYRHSYGYIDRLGRELGFAWTEVEPEPLRLNNNLPVDGFLVTMSR